LLEPPGADELDVLRVFGDDPSKRRLACQARIRPGAGRLRVRTAAATSNAGRASAPHRR
jgi:hypothetical protein